MSARSRVPRLSAHDITVTIERQRLLEGVSIDVAPGEWLNVIGPNGAGKTTLLRVLAGLGSFDGSLRFDGADARQLRRRAWSRKVALVPQAPLIPRAMTVAQYVLLGRTCHIPHLGSETAHDLAVATRAIDTLDLAGFADRSIDTLSGGERQRVVVARMLAQEAPIVLLDEPTAALDIGHQQQVLDLIEQLRHEHDLTVVATMHDLTLAAQYGDRVALLVGGRVIAEGDAIDVLDEAVLAAHYGARLQVLQSVHGPVIVPVRERKP